MTSTRILSLVAGIGLAAVTGAFPAIGADSGPVRIGPEVVLNGNVVPPGSYTVKWTAVDSGSVRVTLTDDRGLAANAVGRWVDLEAPAEAASVAYRAVGEETREIFEIRLGGESRAIRIDRPVVVTRLVE